VEIDLRAGGWRAHGHDRNPAFQNVLLHVVWDDVGVHASACRNRETSNKLKLELQPLPPTLVIGDKLDAPIAELGLWLENDPPRDLPENLRGQCCVALRELDETQQGRILDAAARVRFQAKAEQFRARARHAGWEQALWEGLFRALGYKHNIWPMQKSCRIAPALAARRGLGFRASSTVARHQRFAAGRIDPLSEEYGQLFAPGLGLLVAGTR
jgi:hypothetical protein